ncbi:hypothetical protein O181_073924 [Austropuccinia psidii MF-1]|uniref:Uncharacterized protein n=1 Tax=Austropuccinia psidii MF-1 TaxID=1389203 RepID=A0A9Q3F7P1_9BASI|nr:hypothetical protein [Austropuccinia psidii MF-1]
MQSSLSSLISSVGFSEETISNFWQHTNIYSELTDSTNSIDSEPLVYNIAGLRDAIQNVQAQLKSLTHCESLLESRPLAQMSIQNLINQITEQADQDDILPMPTDEQLAFNVSNTMVTNENQDQSEVNQDDDDHITKAEKIPLNLKEVTIACNQIHYALSS